jgi:ATP-dependent RNA helicase DDX46/PRP5
MKIVNNARPSKQTVLFSATFPRQMEALARKALKRPLEITVGGRSVVCEDVTQIVEVREEESKFVRLLEILGQFYNDESEDARTLIFVDKQEAADNLLRDLIRRGYMCLSLHGGKDQLDRDSTISDFKSGVSNILVATSVAARGLDVKQLKLVVNYECPNHMEDYVHRVGRTGRAGNKGTAYTFITPEQERYAMDIAKALKLSEQPVPPDLQKLVDDFQEKVKTGKERISSSGFGGKGLERLDKDRDMVKKFQKKAYGGEDDDESEDEAEHNIDIEFKAVQADTRAGGVAGSEATGPTPHAFATQNAEELTPQALAAKKAVEQVAARINALTSSNKSGRKAQDIINDINAKYKETAVKQDEDAKEGNPGFAYEIEINDYPQKARWRVTNKVRILSFIINVKCILLTSPVS